MHCMKHYSVKKTAKICILRHIFLCHVINFFAMVKHNLRDVKISYSCEDRGWVCIYLSILHFDMCASESY